MYNSHSIKNTQQSNIWRWGNKTFYPLSFLFICGQIQAAPMECPELPNFDQETQCQNAGFFEKDGPALIREINDKFDIQLEEIFRDNIAHPTYSVEMIVEDLRTYNTCFSNLCNQISVSRNKGGCGGGNTNRIIPTQTNWCRNKQEQFLELQKAKTEYFLNQNVSRKYRSLYEEKLARVGHRFYEYIHKTSMQRTIESLQFAKIMIQWLIKYPTMNKKT